MEKPRAGSKKTTLLLLALSMHPLAHAVADTQPLEFRHGVSQIPNYELKYPADFPHFNYLNTDAPKGGTLVLPTLNPLNTVSPMYQPPGFYPSYDHLIERAGDEPSGYYGSLAESIALSADRRRIVFRLRPQARWHDGRPITAADVKFTVETFRADAMAHGWAGALSWVTGVTILDPITVEIRADSDVAKQLFILGHMPIVPAHYWLDRDVSEPTTTPPPQSGPYRLTGVSQGRYLTYERVPDYWARDLPVNRGKFNFDTIRYERYLDATVAREALRAGLFDVWTETDSRHWLSSYDVPAREAGWLVLGTLASGNQRRPVSTGAEHAAPTVRRSSRTRGAVPCIGLRLANPGLARRRTYPGQQLLCQLHVRFLGITGRSGNSASRTASRAVARRAIHSPLFLPQHRWRGRQSWWFVQGAGTPRGSRLSGRRRCDGQP